MNDRSLRVGVIGTGFGTATLAPALVATPGIELVAFCSARLSRAQAAAAAFGAERAVDDYRALLDDPTLDLVCVCAPPATHVEMVGAAIDAGKHVFSTKPLAESADQARRLLDQAREHNLLHAMDFGRRYMPARRYFRELVQDGYLGRLRYVSVSALLDTGAREGGHAYYASWLSQRPHGGILHASMLNHYIDLVRFVFGEIGNPRGLKTTLIGAKPVLAPEYGSVYGIPDHARTEGTKIADAEDAAVVCGSLANGALLSIVGSWSVFHGSGERVEAYGSDGTLVLDGAKRILGASAGDTTLAELTVPERLAAPAVGSGAVPFYAAFARDFLGAWRGNVTNPIYSTFEDGVRLLEIGEAVDES